MPYRYTIYLNILKYIKVSLEYARMHRYLGDMIQNILDQLWDQNLYVKQKNAKKKENPKLLVMSPYF